MFEIPKLTDATAALARAYNRDRDSIPEREADLLAAKIKYRVERLAEGKTLTPKHRDALCAFIAEVGK